MFCYLLLFGNAIIADGIGMVGWGRKSYLAPAEIASRHHVQTRISAEAISMTHSNMLYQLDISTFYFYKPLLFHIFVH